MQDTAGSAQFENNSDVIFRECDGFIIMYSITARATFGFVEELVEKIIRSKGYDSTADVPATEQIPMVLVGNKVDLSDGIMICFLVSYIKRSNNHHRRRKGIRTETGFTGSILPRVFSKNFYKCERSL